MPGKEAFRHSSLFGLIVSALLTCAGCGGQLRPVKHAELQALGETAQPQGRSPAVRENYRGVVTEQSQWRGYFCTGSGAAAVDDDVDTAVVTPPEHGSDVWLLIDLGENCRFQTVQLRHPDGTAAAKRYRIDVADQRGFPYRLVWAGPGQSDESAAILRRPVEARFIRITVLEESAPRWGVSEVEVF